MTRRARWNSPCKYPEVTRRMIARRTAWLPFNESISMQETP